MHYDVQLFREKRVGNGIDGISEFGCVVGCVIGGGRVMKDISEQ